MLIGIGLIALGFATLAAIAVYALRDFSRPQLRDLLADRDRSAWFEEIVARHHQASLAAESLRVLATTVAVFAAAGHIWSAYVAAAAWPEAILINVVLAVIGILLLWLFLVWLPTAIARVWGAKFIAATWPLWRIATKIFAPSTAAALLLESIFVRISGRPEQHLTEEELEEEIREVVTEGQREGLLEEDAREMIESVIQLGEVIVSEIMTPRTDMVSMPLDISWDEALQHVIASGHTRIPVYANSRDEIVGILHIKDMLHEMADKPPLGRRPVADLLRPPFFVPETKPVDDLLQEFQHSRNHIAVVLDEFSGVKGLVTIEDVLEEIVGEIADEHDDATADGIHPVGENKWESLARVHISEINEKLGVHLPEEEHYDTIGGLVFHRLGRIPRAGEEIAVDGVKVKVLESTRRRINRVGIEMLPPAESPAEDSSVQVSGGRVE